MPVKLERALKATAASRGYGKRRTGAYVYGTLNKIEKGKKKKKGIERGTRYRT